MDAVAKIPPSLNIVLLVFLNCFVIWIKFEVSVLDYVDSNTHLLYFLSIHTIPLSRLCGLGLG